MLSIVLPSAGSPRVRPTTLGKYSVLFARKMVSIDEPALAQERRVDHSEADVHTIDIVDVLCIINSCFLRLLFLKFVLYEYVYCF